MRDAHGPLSTLLLTAPLLVVPTLAAVGLPGADPPDDPAALVLGEGAGTPGDDPAGSLGDGFPDAADDPFGESDFGGAGVQDAEPVRRAGGRAAAAGDGLFADSAPAAVAPPVRHAAVEPAAAPFAADARASEAGRGANPLTETAATADVPALSAKLRALGAERLQLEPSGGRFYFGCTLSAAAGPGGPTIARRFEAEGDTPAAAAVDVLGQVRRFLGEPATGADLAFADAPR